MAPPAEEAEVARHGAPLPEVHPDRTVTFRFRAPQADHVQLVGEIVGLNSPKEMTKDESGIWTATVGPLAPEI